MTHASTIRQPSVEFPAASAALEEFGLKFSGGGAHISRTMMLLELRAVLGRVPQHSGAGEYRDAILRQNVLGKTTDSTRQKSLRHLRELYSLDEATPIFAVLRKLQAIDDASLPLLAALIAWSRDPLFRATTPPVMNASEGEHVETSSLAEALNVAFPNQYSELNRNKVARNAASSWTQSGHLIGRTSKRRQRVRPTAVSVTMACVIGHVSGYHGSELFTNPWFHLLDLDAVRARGLTGEAHRAGLLNLRAIGEIIEVSFPLFPELEGVSA